MITENVIQANLEALVAAKIKFEYRLIGSKRLAIVRLANGKNAMFCARTGATQYKNIKHQTRNADGFIKFINKINDAYCPKHGECKNG